MARPGVRARRIALRLVYLGGPGKPYAAMLGSFIYLSPLLVKAVTVYLAERVKRRDFGYYVAAPFVANCLYVAGTLMIMVEGMICDCDHPAVCCALVGGAC